MIIYEVNLTIQNAIYAEYYHWLQQHVATILAFPGFQHAEIAKEKRSTTDYQEICLTVRYFLKNEEALEQYLTHHAAGMRQEAIDKFGDQFSATRRFFVESININA